MSAAATLPLRPPLPRSLYLETTSRCNSLCETCILTFGGREPQKDLAWEEFRRVVGSRRSALACACHLTPTPAASARRSSASSPIQHTGLPRSASPARSLEKSRNVRRSMRLNPYSHLL